MKIELQTILVRDLVKGYVNLPDEETGVWGYSGRLNIRPPYQREFVYKDAQRNAVIDTVTKGYPLNVMYWVVNGLDEFEILDGQQRTISLCEYVAGKFSINALYYHNLSEIEQNLILDYPLTVYMCEGTNKEKLEWFKTVNISGVKLTDQELRNAVYAGPWVSAAKTFFSKTGGQAYLVGQDYMSGTPIRQDYLETVIRWISDGNIEEYMAKHQHEKNANDLWLFYSRVMEWAKILFPSKRGELKLVPWGTLYREYGSLSYDANELEGRLKKLLIDDDVTKKAGAYEFLFSGNPSLLSIRAFTESMRRESYERQSGVCPSCGLAFPFSQMQGDHITPWSKGGRTRSENCQMLCKDCNRRKSNV